MPTSEEVGPSKADGTDHEYSGMYETIVHHIVVTTSSVQTNAPGKL